MMKNEETDIIKEILNGDSIKYEYFLQRYGQQIFVLVSNIVSCQEDAEEITQDIFLKAFQRLHTFKAESSFSTWLYRIATNSAISAARKRRSTIHWDDFQLANMPDEQVDELLDNQSEQQLKALSDAIEKLNADERAIITLFYTEDKPLSEIADIMGITTDNAKVKLHRIRKKLFVIIKLNNNE